MPQPLGVSVPAVWFFRFYLDGGGTLLLSSVLDVSRVLLCNTDRINRHFGVGNTDPQTKLLMDTTTETVEKTRKVRTREAVLLKVTASKLAELIGDAEIGVSRKELRELVLSKASADVLEKAGL
jgi:hypothetical protein